MLVSDLTFIAPVNAIRYVGAWPVLDRRRAATTGRWTRELVPRVSSSTSARRIDGVLRNRRTGRRVRAILPVHILGHPVDMDPILELAREYGLVVVEDATEASGRRTRAARPGSLGDICLLQLQRQQDHHHRRRRDDRHRPRRLGRPGQVSHHPGQGRPAGVRPQRDRLQLPAHQRAGRHRVAQLEQLDDSSPPSGGSPAPTARCSRDVPGITCHAARRRGPTARSGCTRSSSTRASAGSGAATSCDASSRSASRRGRCGSRFTAVLRTPAREAWVRRRGASEPPGLEPAVLRRPDLPRSSSA